MQDIFVNLSVIIIIAVVVSGIMKLLKQPLLIGYIVTGILVGPYIFDILGFNPVFETFSKIGVALLLFMVGLHLNPKVIKEVGAVSLITGIGQIVFTSLIGFAIAVAFGFSIVTSLYISIALTFSSTIIIMKLLTDIKQIDSLFGKIAVGFLIVQDLFAVFALMIISSFSNGTSFSTLVFNTFFKGFLTLFLIFGFCYLTFPKLTRIISRSQEFLFLFSVGWCLALASLFYVLGFSIEIGALLAGVTLSLSPYHQEISSKTKPLRDFFIVLFFILLGSQMVLGDVTSRWVEILVFSVFILVGNPLIVMTLMGLMGYTKRNGFMAGLTVAQISEFSLILIALGITAGHISSEILSLVTTVGLITIGGSTYMITYSNQLYLFLSPYLSVFEKKKVKIKKDKFSDYDAILFGYNRMGFGIFNALNSIKKKTLIVDFNPETISDLSKIDIPCVYGDAYDYEFLEGLPIEEAKIIVSTIPDYEINSLLLNAVKRFNKKAIIILRAHTIYGALELYKEGADYVLTPHFLGGEYLSKMIKDVKTDSSEYKKEKEKHLKMLKKIKKLGHEHPDYEKD